MLLVRLPNSSALEGISAKQQHPREKIGTVDGEFLDDAFLISILWQHLVKCVEVSPAAGNAQMAMREWESPNGNARLAVREWLTRPMHVSLKVS